ncbi:ornithine cyclodeaminase family protein [Undibacterium sp. CCC2.1]|nr:MULTISPECIES: ornithine cyclodeaminase family protein [unclassified Undibacterium]MEB0138432.1 ornithine cyclodeaminase family protein [Undibacterium sp. CCC2.1]MEB0171307.1 ornithine cyclodeaminase family protein [Undibacterium sp. CCC1.1]MEB0176455.1 ornithine cyclodeaminase family protein [Undibacterium sp. CCC3.4]MEB0214061.1 ornithine cyclodeaminase family protein [Undibacterium sp. 5I2]
MIPYLNQEQVTAALPWAALIDALRAAFCEVISTPARHVHHISPSTDTTLLLMPAWQSDGHTGVKLVTVAPRNTHLPAVQALFILLDSHTGAPLALMDGEALTKKRTAAASALAADYLARRDSRSLLMVGNGHLAPHLALAHCAVRPIEHIRIWGRAAEKSAACRAAILADPTCPPGLRISLCEDLASGCADADIISCATTSSVPLVNGTWVRDGTHIDLVGGFRPDMREADDALMARAEVTVDTYTGALAEAGDLLQCLDNGSLQRAAIVAELAELCRGRHGGRRSANTVTVFKSVGTALEDLAAANLVWQLHSAQQ